MNRPLLSLLILAGCMGNDTLRTSSWSEINMSNLSRIEKGMTQRQVLCIMRQPYETESYTIDPDIYDVWFYVTKPGVLGQTRMVPQNLTPLTFKNGIFIGEGFNYYNYLVKLYEKQQLDYETPSPKKEIKDEDTELERALHHAFFFSMSKPSKEPPKPSNSPLNEDDEELLEEAEDQDFNQT